MRKKDYLKLEEVPSYKISFALSDYVWDIVIQWDFFAKDTTGKQLVRAIDSIAANIAEGFGRYYFKESVKFYYYARGSVFEAQFWCKKAKKRGLITGDQEKHIVDELRKLPREINKLIKITKKRADETKK